MSIDNILLEKVGPANLFECGIGCLVDRKHPGFQSKVEWLQPCFSEGLRFLLFRDGEGKPLGFLEYVPGEHAWRPVDAKGWLFVHCLWVYPRGQKIGGLGSRLIQACLEEARLTSAIGVAAMVSDGPWMAGKEIFCRNDFRVVEAADRFQLVTHHLRDGPEPHFRDISGNLAQYRGLHVVYCAQCPMLSKSVIDLSQMAIEHGLKLNVTVLKNASEAQNAPSYSGTFSLVWNGRLLSDHYVSKGRFKNLLQQEILKEGKRGKI
jgi:GNAT superfamily N-acetyltransferase